MTYYCIALIALGIFALVGIIYVQLDKKHLESKGTEHLSFLPADL